MIQVERIEIDEFRGIRRLSLELGGRSCVVWGPNGAGKSGVVDAIDFALTGGIARLAGRGSGGVTVAKHGPHVHRRDDPSAATVSLGIREAATGDSGLLTRSVVNAKAITLAPDTPTLRAAVEQAQQHPEVTLSRRDIIKYILAEPGARADQVQALLKLDRLGDLRSVLRTTQTNCTRVEKAASTTLADAEAAMTRHIDTPSLLASEVLTAVNAQRAILGIRPLESAELHVDLAEGLDDAASGGLNKASAIGDVQVFRDWLAGMASRREGVQGLLSDLDLLAQDAEAFRLLQLSSFVDTGFQLVVEAACPLCDAAWPDEQSLRAHLAEKLARARSVVALRDQVVSAANSFVQELKPATTSASLVAEHAASLDPELAERVSAWRNRAEDVARELATFETATAGRSAIAELVEDPPVPLTQGVDRLLATLHALPDQSPMSSARTFLTIAQERWRAIRSARARLADASDAANAARTIYAEFTTTADQHLTNLYKTVEARFSAYYRRLNSDDEALFKATLAPSAAKLDLSVDFHGLGMFPPGAYHSEGHQDGMGVCLYLALMRELLGDDFRLAVLDDVVMSVDRSHRRQFCALLREEFPTTQFVITTHDEVWARQMVSAGLVAKKDQVRFQSWTVDDGPTYEQGQDLFDEVHTQLSHGDVPAAAHRLRRGLESIMADLAENLRAPVAFRAEGNYDLGEFLNAVKGRHGRLLGQAAKAAASWSNADAESAVSAQKTRRAAAMLAQEGESWAVNAAVHFNEWASLSPGDFTPVVAAWSQFLDLFRCSNPTCDSWIYVAGDRHSDDSLRCACGTYDLNLKTKPSG